jgi:hypothetical protein
MITAPCQLSISALEAPEISAPSLELLTAH